MTDTQVAVIGGGISGLCASRRLAQNGVSVTLVEADSRLGGKIRTSAFAGRMVDEGADAFLLRVPWAIELCRELGIDDTLVNPAARTAFVWSHGALRPLPPQLMGVPTDLDALAASGLLSPAGVARVAEDLTLPAAERDGDDSIAAVLTARLGSEAVQRLVEPLVGGINAGDIASLSLAAVVPQLDAASRDRDHDSLIEACRYRQRSAAATAGSPIFAAPAGGMERLIDALAADLGSVDVRLGTAVTALEPIGTGSGHLLRLGDNSTLRADAVVLAVPAFVSGRLLEALSPEAASVLRSIEHASVAMITVAVSPADVGEPLERSGFLVPTVERLAALTACSWSSTKWPQLAPEHGDGTVVLRASVGRHHREQALELDDDDPIGAVLNDLALTMGLSGEPTAVRVTRWPRSFPQYAPGHLEVVSHAQAALPGNIALAGATLSGVGVPACIRSGHDAADQMIAASRR